MPDLKLNDHKLARGYGAANQAIQLCELSKYFVAAVIDPETGESLEYRDLLKRPELKEQWQTSFANEVGRLAQGIRDIKGTNTIHFIPRSEIPADRMKDVTYGRLVVEYKPNKAEKNRSRLTAGGRGQELRRPFCTLVA